MHHRPPFHSGADQLMLCNEYLVVKKVHKKIMYLFLWQLNLLSIVNLTLKFHFILVPISCTILLYRKELEKYCVITFSCFLIKTILDWLNFQLHSTQNNCGHRFHIDNTFIHLKWLSRTSRTMYFISNNIYQQLQGYSSQNVKIN